MSRGPGGSRWRCAVGAREACGGEASWISHENPVPQWSLLKCHGGGSPPSNPGPQPTSQAQPGEDYSPSHGPFQALWASPPDPLLLSVPVPPCLLPCSGSRAGPGSTCSADGSKSCQGKPPHGPWDSSAAAVKPPSGGPWRNQAPGGAKEHCSSRGWKNDRRGSIGEAPKAQSWYGGC